MIILPHKCPCQECDAKPRVKQQNKSEKGEYWYCDKYEKIPVDILQGRECKKIVRAD